MIKVNYDATTGEIKGFYPDSIGYTAVPEPNIEIDETKHHDCINNPGRRRVDVGKQVIIEYEPPAPTADEIKATDLAALDAEYTPRFDALTLAWATASMDGNTAVADARKADKATLKAEYVQKKEAIENNG